MTYLYLLKSQEISQRDAYSRNPTSMLPSLLLLQLLAKSCVSRQSRPTIDVLNVGHSLDSAITKRTPCLDVGIVPHPSLLAFCCRGFQS